MKYINKYASLIPAIQGNKAIQRVEEMRSRGEIETEEEYQVELQKILSTLSTTEFKPLFKYEPIVPSVSSSEHFNQMMDLIRDDLEVLFIEINNIFASIKAHELLFKDKLLDELYYTLTELENQQKVLSIIGDVSNSFDDISLNSFNGEAYTIDRNSLYANEVLFDTRKQINIPDEEAVFIDTEEQVVTLPLSEQDDILFVDASIRTAETTVSEKNIQLVDSEINSILDRDSAGSWAYNILTSNQLREGAKLSLELDLGDKREISYLRIHPVSDFPMFIEKIKYVNINNEIVDLPDTSLFFQILESPVRLSFPGIIAKKIILELSQSSSVLFDYNEAQKEITFEDLRRNSRINYDVGILTSNIESTIQNPDLLSVIPLSPELDENYSSFNQYVFAFRSISCGLSFYKDDGYFTSKSYEKEKTGLIAIDSEEDVPKIKNETTGIEEEMSSFEYDIVKKDYNDAGELIGSVEFPVLPLGSIEVKKERLHFSRKYRVRSLRFLGHRSDNTAEHINVYRDDIPLTRGTDWRFVDRNNPLDDSDSDIKPNTKETRIEVLHSSDVIRTGIYTTKYTPRFIEEPNVEVEDRDIVYLPNGTTQHKIKNGIDNIKKSDIFLKIAIRNNSRSRNRTPKLRSYKLMTASVNEDKYVRIK